jgi:hypothetical protein
MEKYKIENNVNFYDELYKSLDIEDDLDEDNNVCLITNEPLVDKHVVMDCGHKFNYIPIYKDIVNHKQKFNGLEGSNGKLHMGEIRCPYCRNKQTKMLPYYEEFGLAKVNGVNFYDPTIVKHYKYTICEYKYINADYDPTIPESDTNKQYLNKKCGHNYNTSQILIYNKANPGQAITYGDTKCYCYHHKKEMIKKYKQKEKDEAKAKAIEEKQKAKEAKQKAIEEKQKAKDAKQKAKEEKEKDENIVLGPSMVSVGCIAILKSGPKKGTQCGCTIKTENMCLKHCKVKVEVKVDENIIIID